MYARRRAGLGIIAVSLLLALSGCSMLGLTTTETGTAGAGADAQASPWVAPTGITRVLTGVPTGSPTPNGVPLSPTPTSVLTPTRTRTSASPYPSECVGNMRPNVLNSLGVTAGAGRATVSWVNVGDPTVVSYRLAAIPQTIYHGTQPDAEWTTIAPGRGCRTITQTVTGLKSGEAYIFWLDAVYNSYEFGVNKDIQIARSQPIVIK